MTGTIEVDPEDTEQIGRLAAVISAALGGVPVPVDKLQAAARRFVNPPPPEPEEFGSVITDEAGVKWTRWATVNQVQRWINESGQMASYDQIVGNVGDLGEPPTE